MQALRHPSRPTSIEQQFDAINAEISELYRQFHTEVTGGPIIGRLRQLANPTKDQLKDVPKTVEEWLGPLALSTTQIVGEFLGRFAIGLAVMIISLYYFLADGPRMVASVMRLLPLDDRYERQMLHEFDKVSLRGGPGRLAVGRGPRGTRRHRLFAGQARGRLSA